MDSRRIALILLALNLAFVGVVIYLIYLLRISPTAQTRVVSETKVLTNTVTRIAVRKVNATNLLGELRNRLTWAGIESTNYFTYIANLRAIACPDETIRDIIITDVAKLYARRRAEVRGQDQFQYWKTGDEAYEPTPETRQQIEELNREQRLLIKELLGVDLPVELAQYFDSEDTQQRMLSFLPEIKREQVMNLQAKYDQLEQDLFARTKGVLLEEDQQQLNLLQQQKEAELAQMLSSEEMEEYDLRSSQVAANMRASMAGFQPSEEEFRKLFRLQKSYDKELNQNFDVSDPKQAELRSMAEEQAQQALAEEYRRVLGDARFAEYQRSQDNDYRTVLQVAERFNLPNEVAGKVYAIKNEAQRAREQLETANLTLEQREIALAALGQETLRSVQQTMGKRVYDTYEKLGADWLRELNTLPDPPEMLEAQLPVQSAPVPMIPLSPYLAVPAPRTPPMPPQKR